MGRMEPRALDEDPALRAALLPAGWRVKPERVLLLHLEAFDWNCPQHITPRFTEDELGSALEPVRRRIERLEAENAALRARLAAEE